MISLKSNESELSSNSTITSTLVSSTNNDLEKKISNKIKNTNSSISSSISDLDSGDDDEDENSEEEEEEEKVQKRLKDLLLKAKLSARSKSLLLLLEEEEKKKKNLKVVDGLTNQSELVLFSQEDEEDNSNSQLIGPSTSTKQTFPNSLTRPLSLRTPTTSSLPLIEGGRGLTNSQLSILKGKGKETNITLAQDLGSSIIEASSSSSSSSSSTRTTTSSTGSGGNMLNLGLGGKGDKWGRAPLPSLSKKQMKARHLPTAGPGWFNMAAPVMTPELKREIQAMRLRNALDPKRFYKGGAKDDKKLPEFFSFGHILPSTSSASTASPGIPRKRTFVEELISDEQAKAYTKKKFVGEVMTAGMSGRARQKKNAKGKKPGRVR